MRRKENKDKRNQWSKMMFDFDHRNGAHGEFHMTHKNAIQSFTV